MPILRNTFLIILLAISFSGAARGGDQTEVSWAFFLKDGEGRVKSLEFDQAEKFSAGDLLRIYIQLHERSYVYLYLYDSRQDLYLVFPPTPDFYSAAFPAQQKFYIPSGRSWLTLDNSTGKERFYLLTANHRLLDLEGLTDQFLMDRDDHQLRDRLLAEINHQITLIGQPATLEQHRQPVPYFTSLAGSHDQQPGNFANLTRATGDFSLTLELLNP